MNQANLSNYAWIYSYIKKPIRYAVEIGSRDCLDAIEISDIFDAKVLAFEPDRNCFKICEANIRRKENCKVEVRNIALSNIDGLRNFYIYSAGNSSLHKIENSIPDRIEENEVRRYDTLNLPIPDLIVMDAQGHEHRILEGFGKGLRNTRYICFETSFKVPYENAGDFENIHKYLSKLGFRFVASNVSGIGIINFRIMKIRGMLFSLRRSKGKSLFFYQSFFDVLYERK